MKLVADFGDEAAETEVEVARIERDELLFLKRSACRLAMGNA